MRHRRSVLEVNVSTILPSLALLACPLGMGVMMWMMARGHKHQDQPASTAQPPSVELLREEHQRLGAEIERLEGDRTPGEPATPAR